MSGWLVDEVSKLESLEGSNSCRNNIDKNDHNHISILLTSQRKTGGKTYIRYANEIIYCLMRVFLLYMKIKILHTVALRQKLLLCRLWDSQLWGQRLRLPCVSKNTHRHVCFLSDSIHSFWLKFKSWDTCISIYSWLVEIYWETLILFCLITLQAYPGVKKIVQLLLHLDILVQN